MPIKVISNTSILGAETYRPIKLEKERETHLVYSLQESEKLNNEIMNLERKIKNLENEHIREIEDIKQKNENNLNDLEEKALEKIQALKNNCNTQIELNKDLKRICTERANSKRNLTNKKNHTGYILLSSEQHEMNYRNRYGTYEISYWINKFQTPYELLINNYSSISNLFENDFFSKLKDIFKIDKFYKNHVFKEDNFIDEQWNTDKNFIFKYKFKMNGVKGFWEVEFWTKYKIQISNEVLVK